MFVKNYSITVDKPYEEALGIFKNNLDDMGKKGYSNSTVILNSDHRLKLFTGEWKNDAWVVRPADSNDFYYRFLPKMQIRFVDKGNQTEINVKTKHIRPLIMFIICLVFIVAVLPMAVIEFVETNDWKMFLFPIAPAVIMLVSALVSVKQINDGKIALEYIYK